MKHLVALSTVMCLSMLLIGTHSLAQDEMSTDSCFCPGAKKSDFMLEKCPEKAEDGCAEHFCSYVSISSGTIQESPCASKRTEYCACNTMGMSLNYQVIEDCPVSVTRGVGPQCGDHKCHYLVEYKPGLDIPLSFPCAGF